MARKKGDKIKCDGEEGRRREEKTNNLRGRRLRLDTHSVYGLLL